MGPDVRELMIEALPRLRRFAFGLTGSKEAADDLVQSACERALARLHQFEPGTRMDSWMYRITQTLWIDELRRRRTRGDVVPLDEQSQLQSRASPDRTEASLELDEVVRAMDELAPEQRAVLVLVCAEGLSYKETASVLGLPVGTVMSRLSRARTRLHALVSGNETLSAVRG